MFETGTRSPSTRTLIVAAITCLALAAVALAFRGGSADPIAEQKASTGFDSPDAAIPEPVRGAEGVPPEMVGAVITTRTVDVVDAPGSDSPMSRLRAGILLPVTSNAEGFFQVLTPCQVAGWVPEGAVERHPIAVENPDRFAAATFVLDAGHGGIQPGAVGPTGLTETEVNLDIVRRLTDLMAQPRRIDPATGDVVDGSEYGTPRVFLTRDQEYMSGLRFRTTIANTLKAAAFVSVHNNAEPDGPLPGPGTETYYQIASAASKRLAGLAYGEIVRALEPYEVAWVGDRDAGAKYRQNRRGGDYYGVLRMSEVPSVLVEATFISNPPEEQLLARGDVRHEIAEAIYRALVRFVETDEPGTGFTEPYGRGSGPSGGLPPTCTDPI